MPSWQVTGQTVPLPLPLFRFLQATVLYAVPPVVLFLASHPDVLPKYLQSLRHVGCGAAPLGGLDAERFLKRAPPNTNIVQGSMWPLLYLTNIFICFLLALVDVARGEPASMVGSHKICSSNKITTLYTGCPRRNVQYFGRVFLMLNYTDITQNTYIQS